MPAVITDPDDNFPYRYCRILREAQEYPDIMTHGIKVAAATAEDSAVLF
jgi:hypothetical protein